MLLFLLSCAHHAASPNSDRAPLPLDPNVRHGVLANGVSWFIEPGTYPAARAELRLAIKAGAVREEADQYGAAHLLEHLAFQGSAHFASNELVAYMESVGMKFGADTNAYTNMDETVYKLRVPTEDLAVVDRGLTWLSDVPCALTLSEERIEHERSVVLEEWRRSRGAGQRFYEVLFPLVFAGTPYATHTTIGTEASIAGLTRETITRFYQRWYRPDAMAVVVAGDIDPERAQAMIEAHFGGLVAAVGLPEAEPTPPAAKGLSVLVRTDPEQTSIDIGLSRQGDDPVVPTYGASRAQFAEGMVLVVLAQRLADAGQAPDAPFVGAGPNFDRQNTRMVQHALYARAKDGHVKEALDALLVARDGMARFGPTVAETQRARSALEAFLGSRLRGAATEDPASRVEEIVEFFLHGEPLTSVEFDAKVTQIWFGEITPADLKAAAARMLPRDGWVVSLTGPAGAAMPTEAEVRALVLEVASRDLPPPVDAAPPPHLLPTLPTPGTTTATRVLPAFDATEWTLSNGARVVVRPSQDKPDEIRFAAWSPGGVSGGAPADVVPAGTAVDIAGASGLGELGPTELSRALAGRSLSSTVWIGDSAEGVRGGSVPADLEVALQLLHQQFVAARFTDEGAKVVRERREESLRSRLQNPDAVFDDRMRAAVFGAAPWRRAWALTDLDGMDRARSEAIYRERFGNAADFVFAFVGAVDLATLQPLVERYVGSLPGHPGAREAFSDDGVRPAAGVHADHFQMGVAPKASVEIRFGGTFAWSPEARVLLSGTVDALQLRLRDAIREEEAGTYDISASAQMWARPTPGYTLRIRFSCDPARREALTEKVMAAVRDAREKPLPDELVAKVREAKLRAYDTDQHNNGWWLDGLERVYEQGDPEDSVLTYVARVGAITPDAVMGTARTYLDLANMFELDRSPSDTK